MYAPHGSTQNGIMVLLKKPAVGSNQGHSCIGDVKRGIGAAKRRVVEKKSAAAFTTKRNIKFKKVWIEGICWYAKVTDLVQACLGVSKRPFRDSNYQYAFRLTTIKQADALYELAMLTLRLQLKFEIRMASSISSISEDLGELDGRITDFSVNRMERARDYSLLQEDSKNGFQKLEKIKDSGRQSRQLEELTDKMRECKSYVKMKDSCWFLWWFFDRLIKEFEREVKDLDYTSIPHASRMLNERKQSMVKELNSYVELKKKYASNIERKRVGHIEGTEEVSAEDNGLLASSMTNQELVGHGNQMMDETDQAIERSKKVVHDTVNVGSQTAATLKGQTEQMNRIIDDLDSIHFSIKKASRLVKELGKQIATDRCIMSMLFLIVIGVIAIIIVKVRLSYNKYYINLRMAQPVMHPENQDIQDLPGLAPPATSRKLLWFHT
ncbi:Target SNARE coiled-coil domain-containing protein, partial [Cynara cardunculus var. scolymus]